MADEIVSLSTHDLASRIEEETANLSACRTLMLDALEFMCSDLDSTMRAQSQLFYLVNSLKDQQVRFEAIGSAAYALHRTQQAAA